MKQIKMTVAGNEIVGIGSFELENKGHYKIFEFVDSVEIAQEMLANIPASELKEGDEALFVLPDGTKLLFVHK